MLTLSADDVTGVSISRSHNIRRQPSDRPDLKILGPGWRPEFLGGVAGSQLADHIADGYVEVTDQDGGTVRYTKGADGAYTGPDGATLSVDGPDKMTERPISDLTLTWSRAGGHWRVASVATTGGGTSAISYDQQGRVARIVAPAETAEGTTPAACGPQTDQGCS